MSIYQLRYYKTFCLEEIKLFAEECEKDITPKYILQINTHNNTNYRLGDQDPRCGQTL